MESSVNSGYNSKYNLSALRTGLNLIEEDSTGRWILRTEVSTGLPVFGAKVKKEDESDATSKFVKLKGNIVRVQALPLKSFGIFRLSAQYSPSHLLSAEQIQVGGMYSVRGFTEGVLYGDIGYNLTLEAKKAIPVFLTNLSIPYWKDKAVKIPLKDRLYFSVFYDQAISKELKQNVPFSYKNFIQSIGTGLNLSLSKYINLNMYMGVPLGRQRNNNQTSVKFHFGISSDLI